jgi:hypothetical protein
MPEWVAAILAGLGVLFGGALGFIVHLAMEVAALKERVRSLGQQLSQLPKRRGDRDGG